MVLVPETTSSVGRMIDEVGAASETVTVRESLGNEEVMSFSKESEGERVSEAVIAAV